MLYGSAVGSINNMYNKITHGTCSPQPSALAKSVGGTREGESPPSAAPAPSDVIRPAMQG